MRAEHAVAWAAAYVSMACVGLVVAPPPSAPREVVAAPATDPPRVVAVRLLLPPPKPPQPKTARPEPPARKPASKAPSAKPPKATPPEPPAHERRSAPPKLDAPRATPSGREPPRRGPAQVAPAKVAAPETAAGRPDRRAAPARRVIRATPAVVAAGRRLDREGRTPEVSLAVPDEAAFLGYFERRGGGLFVECGGRITRGVAPGTRSRLTAPDVRALDRAHPRSLRGSARAAEVLEVAAREGLTGCSVVMLVPAGVHDDMRHAVFGGLETALPSARAISDLSRVEGVYRFDRAAPSILLRGADLRTGRSLALDVLVQL